MKSKTLIPNKIYGPTKKNNHPVRNFLKNLAHSSKLKFVALSAFLVFGGPLVENFAYAKHSKNSLAHKGKDNRFTIDISNIKKKDISFEKNWTEENYKWSCKITKQKNDMPSLIVYSIKNTKTGYISRGIDDLPKNMGKLVGADCSKSHTIIFKSKAIIRMYGGLVYVTNYVGGVEMISKATNLTITGYKKLSPKGNKRRYIIYFKNYHPLEAIVPNDLNKDIVYKPLNSNY